MYFGIINPASGEALVVPLPAPEFLPEPGSLMLLAIAMAVSMPALVRACAIVT
jgi:hypothetical protein